MPITLNCPKCKKPFRVRDESVGLRVKCPNCQAILQVPATLAPASAPGSDLSPPAPDAPLGAPPVTAPRPFASAPPVVSDENDRDFLDDLPAPSPGSGPPSLPPHPVLPTRPEPKTRPQPFGVIEPDPAPASKREKGRGRPQQPQPQPLRPGPTRKSLIPTDETMEVVDGWRSVRGGLRWVQIGLFLALIPALRSFGETVYLFVSKTNPNVPKYDPFAKGYLINTLSFGQEITYGLSFIPLILAYLCILLGRTKCNSVPDSAKTRGLASGTWFFTLLAFIGMVGFGVTVIGPKLANLDLPNFVRPIAQIVFIAFGLLAELWFVLFLAQTGFAVGSLKILREFALSILLVTIAIAGVAIAERFYPLSNFRADNILNDIYGYFDRVNGTDLAENDESSNRRFLVTSGIAGGIAFICLFRLIVMSGMLRKSIRRSGDDRAVVDA